ncbi:ABC transporter substrate-binding protein [Pseudactinotalea terrae]|uniref:ABC transporter substrate-binding protein n=1 Tax=Pseudactinotalea terrae TaxID=1743262 RepID=UPI0012E2EB00|nr:ABC transporter substrate-binding protein [Pseudactinotalea terrae]
MATTNRRGFLTLAGVSALAVPLLAACNRDTNDPFADDTGGGESGGGEGGVAVIVTDADPESLNPGQTTSNQTLDVCAKIFEALVWIDPDGQPAPLLATEWTISEDELVYTFTLREGVTWHDGEPFTSADVVWTIEEGMPNNSRAQGVIAQIASVEAPGDYEVVITLIEPYAPLLQQLKVFDLPIIPKHVFEGTDLATNAASRAPIGTGPFRFSEWDPGRSLLLVANEEYWDEGKPGLSEIIYQIVPDAANRSAGLETGEYDFVGAFYLPRADVARLKSLDNVVVREQTTIPSLHFIQFNHQNEHLGKREVRQAIAKVVDRPRIVEQAMAGLGLPGVGSFGEGFPWLVNEEVSYDILYPLDPDAARSELESAGVPEGTTLRLTYDAAKPQFQAASQIVRDNLSAIGIEVTIEPLETSVYRDAVYAQRDFDLALQSFTSSGDPAIGYHRIYRTNETNDPNVNATGYSNAEVDALLEQAETVSDLEKRGEFYKQAQVILNEDVPTLVMYDELQADAVSTRLEGLFAGINPVDRWGEVTATE